MNEVSKEQQLLELLKAGKEDGVENLDPSTVRYALYVRKSTTSEDRQASSIEDQIKECMERVAGPPYNLNVVKIYQESFSAKIADTREQFNQLIEDIQHGRIDGLIAWHPDRLSRNMKEAGTIIDLVDRRLIRDLRFATFTFENNPAGKMLLGITFVMAKQYSEHLSESVDRGNRRASEDGEFIGKFKHGYILDSERHFQPDPVYFTKVKHMFAMALDGKSQKDIRIWINEQDYRVQKLYGNDPVRHTFTKDGISKLLRSPFYCGVLEWGKNYVNMKEFYDFEPMVTVDEFLQINKIESLETVKISAISRPKSEGVRADFLRGMVYCGDCNKTFICMIIDKKNEEGKIYKSYFKFRCDTPNCRMKGKSARGKLVIDSAQQFLSDHLFVTEDNFGVYIKNAELALKKKEKEMTSAIARLRTLISNKTIAYEKVKELVWKDSSLQKHYNLDKYSDEIDRLRKDYDKLLAQKRGLHETLPTYQEYLKLFSSTSVILSKIRDMKQMDEFIRIFFSNFIITAGEKDFRKGSTVTFKLKEPWVGFLQDDNFVHGAG